MPRALIDRLQQLVRSRQERGELALHGWHYLIEAGEVSALDLASGAFARVAAAEMAYRTPF